MSTFPRQPTPIDDDDAEAGRLHSQRQSSSSLSSWLSRLMSLLLRIVATILPSWLQPHGDKDPERLKRTRPTMYLDGLRGLVALMVFIRHFSLPWQRHLDYGHGYQGYDGFLRLPFARLLFSGPLVPVFFMVSGYVLSAKTLKLSRTKSWESLLLGLSASAFRRAIRLFLPPIVSTFGVAVLASLGFFSFPYGDMPGRKPVHPAALASTAAQLTQWLDFVWNELTNPWRWDIPSLLYGPHLWTIPISFKGSLVVFLVCIGLARVRPGIRLCLLIMLSTYTLLHSRWDMAPFLNGMILCEFDVRRRAKDHSEWVSRFFWIRRAAGFLCFIAGLYLGSFPRFNAHGKACVKGYRWLCQITSNYRYWHGLSALMIMFPVSREELLQLPLQSALLQYLGSISFSMYIVHEPFLHVFGFFTVPWFWALIGNDTVAQYQVGFLLGMAASGFCLVWLADLFKCYLEEPCGRLSGWIEKLCLV